MDWPALTLMARQRRIFWSLNEPSQVCCSMSVITLRVLPCEQLTKSLLPDYETKVICAPSEC